MASKHQRRLWHCIDSGHQHKLRRLLQRHRETLDLSETTGRKRRTPLHRSCALLDHKAALLLLKHGADPALPDRCGNTALHVAAKRVARMGGRAYEDLFLPLRNHCPSAMRIKNRAGKTPGDLLGAAEEKWCPQETLEEKEAECKAEKEWRGKLLSEWEEEFLETSWQNEEDYYSAGPNWETYEDWADRISREYKQKRRQEEARHFRQPQREPPESSVKLQGFLEEEHRLYLERAQAKQEELKAAKKRRYEEGCLRVFSSDSAHPLRYEDIPWPSPAGTPEEMANAALHGLEPSDKTAYRRFLRRQQALWHPDKFAQRCGTRLAERDRPRILATVIALSQAFNRLAEAAK